MDQIVFDGIEGSERKFFIGDEYHGNILALRGGPILDGNVHECQGGKS